MPHKLPDFASQWIQQWKQAAPRLQAIRDEELRRLSRQDDVASKKSAADPVVYDRYPERNGLVIMQRWFVRRHLLELGKLTRQQE